MTPNPRMQARCLTWLAALTLPISLSAEIDQAILDLGAGQYQTCALCHGSDGMGAPAGNLLMAPPLAESEYVKGDYPELLAAIILKGIKKESNTYLQVMLPLEAVLDNANLAAVMTYVRHQFASKDEVITADQVGEWREKYADFQMLSRAELTSLQKDLAPKPKLLENLEYAIYEGQWKKVPHFKSLEPVKTGTLEEGVVSLDPAKDLKGGFGMVFKGNLNIPKKETVELLLASDDGSRLYLDGELAFAHDGIHPMSARKKKYEFEAGVHGFELHYFEGGGQRGLSLVIRSDKMGMVPLSKYVHRDFTGTTPPPPDPILISPEQPGEAVMYRNFLAGANPRAIGVGYPGEVNLCWDADIMNLAMVWRGPFIDASRHWTNRGQGDQPPMGYDVVTTGWGLPMQVLESLDDPWIPQNTEQMLIQRDVPPAERTAMGTFNIRHPDYQFLGYTLDEKRIPTFRYRYKDLEVSDGTVPVNVDAGANQSSQGLKRTIQIQGDPAESTYFRIADSGSLEGKNGWYDVSGPVKLKVEGAEAIIRESEGKKELLLKVAANQEIHITYWWPVPVLKNLPVTEQ